MKKVRKILLFSLLGIVLIGIILGFVFGGADSIGNFLGNVYYGYVEFEWDQEPATKVLVYSIFAAAAFIFAMQFAVNVRRKKSKSFAVYGILTLLYLLFGIFGIQNGVDYIKDAGAGKGAIAAACAILPGLLLILLTILSIPAAFEHSELHSNSKEADGWKIADLSAGIALAVLYIPLLLIVSGSEFNIFKPLLGTLTVVLTVIQLFVYGFWA